MNQTNHSEHGRQVSLKWKTLFSLSLVVLTINTLFYLLQSNALDSGFNQQHEEAIQRQKSTIQALLEKSSRRLEQIGSLTPSLYDIYSLLQKNNTGKLIKVFDSLWPSLQFDLNIEYLAIYNHEAKLISDWGGNYSSIVNDKDFGGWVSKVIKIERPSAVLRCASSCMQFAIVPIMHRSKLMGSIVIGENLADLIYDFNRLENADLAILIREFEHSNISSAHMLPRWQSRLTAASHKDHTFKNLRLIEEKLDLETLIAQGHRQVNIQQQILDVWVLPIGLSTDKYQGYGFIVADLTPDITKIDNAKRNTLIIGIVGLILSEIVVLMILWKPLSRLKKISNTLPLLSNTAFSEFRQNVKKNKLNFLHDEIDSLNMTAITLADKLEHLYREVSEKSEKLALNMSKLEKEMHFVRRLLDTAQVIILTLDKNNNILLINNYGMQITGFTRKELIGRPYSKIFESSSKSFENLIAKVHSGETRHTKDENKLLCKNGQYRNVTWLHSYLPNSAEREPAVLSVGLDITEMKLAEERVTWLADHDSLTGLVNRRRFQELFENLLLMSARYQHNGAVIFLDLDNFKAINDTQGHHTGDLVLKKVANTLSQILRSTDIITRLGGDEFAVALPEIEESDVCTVAKSINKKLYELDILGGKSINRLSASIGVALFPMHGSTATELLSNADLAMYQAKQRGKACWHIFSVKEKTRELLEIQLLWQNKIQHAIEHDGFVLYYQPVLDLKNNSISHYEALVRMIDANGDLILPKPFINVAERTGLINTIDHWVMNEVTDMLSQSYSTKAMKIAINLSAHAFSDQSLVPKLASLCKSKNIIPENLILEITETAALEDFSNACDMVSKIRDMGYSFALDDFGVGFASFYYLQKLPVDYIKIDGSFVQQLSHNTHNQTLVKAITDVAKGFGKKTIAEYVEDKETLKILKQFNVDFAQGYYIGQPDRLMTRSIEAIAD